MGTHPIFESDFDCLTDGESISNSDDVEQPSWTTVGNLHVDCLCIRLGRRNQVTMGQTKRPAKNSVSEFKSYACHALWWRRIARLVQNSTINHQLFNEPYFIRIVR